jgi:hypothetical protein
MTEPQLPFNGDYTATLDAYKSLQSMHDKTKSELNQQVTSLQEQINQLSAQKAPSNTKPEGDSGGASLFDWYNGQMRTETGEVNPGLIAAMEKAGAPADLVSQFVSTIETAQGIVKQQGQQIVEREAGSAENFGKLVEFAKTSKSPSEVAKLNQLLDDPDMAPYAIQRLKQDYQAAGHSFESAPEQPTNTEPSPLTTPTGSGPGGVAPLKPNDPNTARIVAEAYQSGDTNKIAEVESRLKVGASLQ